MVEKGAKFRLLLDGWTLKALIYKTESCERPFHYEYNKIKSNINP